MRVLADATLDYMKGKQSILLIINICKQLTSQTCIRNIMHSLVIESKMHTENIANVLPLLVFLPFFPFSIACCRLYSECQREFVTCIQPKTNLCLQTIFKGYLLRVKKWLKAGFSARDVKLSLLMTRDL